MPYAWRPCCGTPPAASRSCPCPAQPANVVTLGMVVQTVWRHASPSALPWDRPGLPLVWGWYGRGLFKPYIKRRQLGPERCRSPADGFLRLIWPTKREPASDIIVNGAPNLSAAHRSAAAALSETASPNGSAPVTQREASPWWVVSPSPFVRALFATCRSAFRMAFERGRSYPAYLRCLGLPEAW